MFTNTTQIYLNDSDYFTIVILVISSYADYFSNFSGWRIGRLVGSSSSLYHLNVCAHLYNTNASK